MSYFCPTETIASVRHMLAHWLPIYERAYANEPVDHRRTNKDRVLKRFNPHQRKQAIARLRAGEGPAAIAKDMNCCESTIRYYRRFV